MILWPELCARGWCRERCSPSPRSSTLSFVYPASGTAHGCWPYRWVSWEGSWRDRFTSDLKAAGFDADIGKERILAFLGDQAGAPVGPGRRSWLEDERAVSHGFAVVSHSPPDLYGVRTRRGTAAAVRDHSRRDDRTKTRRPGRGSRPERFHWTVRPSDDPGHAQIRADLNEEPD
jgi:hypothetical protein